MKSGKPDPTSGSPDDSREKWIAIDRLCDAYEASLQEGAVERAPFLAGVPVDWRDQLMRELDAIDAAYRDAEETREQTLKADADEPCSRRLPTRSRLAELATLDSNKIWLGRFEIRKRLGTGATGSVWCARDARLARWVALKVPHMSRVMSETTAARFQTEARAAAAISHPNVVQVHEVLIEDGLPILIQQWIDGPSLAKCLKDRGPMDFDTAAGWMAQIADAVASAHEKGIVHRDLKPANVMIAKDRPMVLDFGLASYPQFSSGLTSEGAVLGTPAYMSPEQAEGADHANQPPSDIYALGAILYEMLVGAPPFVGKTREVLQATMNAIPTPPRSRRPGVPRDLETIVLRCLAKNPAARYRSAAELRDDLQRFIRREPIRARKVSTLENALVWCRMHPAKAVLVGLIPLIAILALGMVTSQVQQNRLYREKAAGESAQEQLRIQRHMIQLARASYELSEGDRTRGMELLRTVPEDLRGWEWRLLDLVSHSPRQALNDRLPAGTKSHSPINALAIARDSRKLFAASRDGTLCQWTLPSERHLFPNDRGAAIPIGRPTVLIRTGQPIQAVTTSPDENWLAWVDQQGDVYVWNLRENELSQHLEYARFHRGFAIAFSPDSKRLIIGGGGPATERLPADGRSWMVALERNEAGEFAEVSRARTNQRIAIRSLVWVSDDQFVCTRGQTFSSSSSIGFVERWSLRKNRFILNDMLSRGLAMRGLDFHAATDQIAWCDAAGIVYVQNLSVERQTRQFQAGRHQAHQVKFAPDGDELVVVGSDGCVSQWFVGKPEIPVDKDASVATAKSPPEEAASTTETAAAEPASDAPATTTAAGEINDAKQRFQRSAATPPLAPLIRHLRDYRGHENSVSSAIFLQPLPALAKRHTRGHPARLITAGADGHVTLWSHSGHPQIDTVSVGERILTDATWLTDQHLAIATFASRRSTSVGYRSVTLDKHGIEIDVHHARTSQRIGRPTNDSREDESAVGGGSAAETFRADPIRTHYIIQGRDRVFVFQLGNHVPIRECKLPDIPRAAFTAACLINSRYVIAAVSHVVSEEPENESDTDKPQEKRQAMLLCYDIRSDAPPRSMPLADIPAITLLKSSPDGSHLIGGTNRGQLFTMAIGLQSWSTGKLPIGAPHCWQTHDIGRINDLAWIGDSGTLATVADDGTCILWDPVPKQSRPVDRRTVTTAGVGQPSLSALRDPPRYRSGNRLYVSSGPVTAVDASATGDRIATVSADGVIRIWDTESGLELIRLEQRKQPIAAVEFSPNDSYLMIAETGGRLETIRLRDYSTSPAARGSTFKPAK